MSASAFNAVEMAPRDPILGLTEQFNADANPNKVNLGIGVYCNDEGKLPVLRCVAEAERQLLSASKPKAYLPIDGIAAYDKAVQGLVFGEDSPVLKERRVATVQTLGGTGGLKVGADFLQRLNPKARVMISDPSWENHRALFSQAGFEVITYPYYDAANRGIRFDDMLASLNSAEPGTVVVLHACCHNPTGYDLSEAQWQQVAVTCRQRSLMPYLDMAYQGFGKSIQEDGAAVRLFVSMGLDLLVSTSFSKSFSLYGERVGALSVVCSSDAECARVLSQLKVLIRTNYSNPPNFGAQLVTTVLGDPGLRQMWEDELATMRDRIRGMRTQLVAALKAQGVTSDLGYITQQMGMFSYSGLNTEQMLRLRSESAIYGLDSGRICVAALNSRNLGAVAKAIAQVM